MSEATEEVVPVQWRIAFAIGTLAFNAAVIAWCIVEGKTENMLHQNALSWSYISGCLVLGGVGFAQVINSPAVASLLKR